MKKFLCIGLMLALMLLSMSSLASAYYYSANKHYYGPVVYPGSSHYNTYSYGRNGWNYYGVTHHGGYMYPYASPYYGGYGYGYYGGYGGWGRPWGGYGWGHPWVGYSVAYYYY